MNDTLAAIERRMKELEAELAESPLYRELSILRRARTDLLGLRHDTTPSNALTSTSQDIVPKKVTMLEGARMALGAKGYPLSVHELIEIMPQFGARVGGEKPAVNLSSVLSKRGCGFQSVKWHGRHAWWFVDKPLPDAIALFEESESQTSQDKLSDSNPKQEDRENAATLNERTDR